MSFSKGINSAVKSRLAWHATSAKGSSEAEPPIIVLGAHRSGTSALAEALRQLGLFLGHDLNSHFESQHILNLNRGLLSWLGGHWDRPLVAHESLHADPRLLGLLATWLSDRWQGKLLRGYRPHFHLRRRMTGTPWGWKEPRTCLTIVVWAQLFPTIRTVHIVRNGINVADSLKKREDQRLRGWHLRRSLPKYPNINFSARCLDWNESLNVWAEYESLCLSWLRSQPGNLVYSVRYEDLLADPETEMIKLADFLGLPNERAPQASEVFLSSPAPSHAKRGVPDIDKDSRASQLLRFYGYI